MPQRPSVAIVGAGPAGLAAGAILHRAGWPVTIMEGDASPDARDQGGTLDLHPHEGQSALHKAGLLDAFLAKARHEDQEERVLDFGSGAVLHEEIPAPGTGDRPEIDRAVLRAILLDAVDAASVRWNMAVERVTMEADGSFLVRAGAGELGPFDLVIGADGAWSRVRAALTPVRPSYTGVTFVELWLGDVDRRHSDAARLVGHGTMFALHGGAGIIAQRNGGGTIRLYAAFRTTADEGDRPDRSLASITTAGLLARFVGWADPLRGLIARADRIAAVRPIVTLPAGLRWPHRRGLTLVGDAAHVMPPLGVGVNLAMLDAAELAEALVTADDWSAAVRSAEAAMLDRAERCAAETIAGFADMFSGKGGAHVLRHHAEAGS